jgi:hypothetical protein
MDPFAKKMIYGALVFGSVMALMAAAVSVVYFHLYPKCAEQVLSQATSPDKKWIAAVLERRCGEESPFLLHVNLRGAEQYSVQLGYFSGRATDGEIFVVEGDAAGPLPVLEWTSPSQLTIRCAHCSSAFARKLDERWGTVLVRYETK